MARPRSRTGSWDRGRYKGRSVCRAPFPGKRNESESGTSEHGADPPTDPGCPEDRRRGAGRRTSRRRCQPPISPLASQSEIGPGTYEIQPDQCLDDRIEVSADDAEEYLTEIRAHLRCEPSDHPKVDIDKDRSRTHEHIARMRIRMKEAVDHYLLKVGLE